MPPVSVLAQARRDIARWPARRGTPSTYELRRLVGDLCGDSAGRAELLATFAAVRALNRSNVPHARAVHGVAQV